MAEGYCPKCKSRKGIGHAQAAVLKNGRRAVKGRCVSCGNSLYKILDGARYLHVTGSAVLQERGSRFRKVAPEGW